MKKILGLSLLMGILLLSGCAISHTYGPYMGKVVVKDTGEPIEGAVVFISFYTRLPTPGGPVGYYADATEVLTNGQGQFAIPSQRVLSMKPLQYWDLQPLVTIFKPGYGAFPRYSGTTINPKNEWFPANEQITVQLPQLNTSEERLTSLGDAGGWDRDAPCEKQRLILKLYNSERVFLKLEPIMTNICRENDHE